MTTDALARLREQVRRLERRDLPHSHTDTLATGHSAVDAHLGGGLRTGSLHDFLISDPLETGASLAMLLPILKEGRGPIFWISDTPAELNAWGLHQSGLSPDTLVCIETDTASLLAVAEDVLRGPERALAVISGSHVPSLKEIRRLNLAVEASGNTGFFLRSAPLTRAPGKDPCACATRWRILSHPSSPRFFPGLAMPLPGSRRLSAALLRVRGGRPAHWILDCTDHAPLSRSLDALLAHRAPSALPPGRLPGRQAARCARAGT
ncbi:hypothetical protein JK176_12650 [Gluconobacter sp. Dm-73]|uniref:ImuA family protein n=1 Tax=Gluconobacter sp. Dm-73 TaxID=2799802 RepID=UPI001B8D5EDE|nr:hypothetical protein [Gluconobacter sp. Dm-73]MBS1075730.1 hypothetical protein [Gluconobacter sp. Dm-73]